jgi:hypothetical protein
MRIDRSCKPVFVISHAEPIAALALAVLAAGCGGSNGNGMGAKLSGNTNVVVLASSTANDELSELALNITGVSLTNKEGKTVNLLTTPQYVEFMPLNGGVQPLVTMSVPQDIYTSATISFQGEQALCVTYQSSNPNQDSSFGRGGGFGPDATVNLPEPITVTGTGMGLELNLQVSQSVYYTSCPGISNDVSIGATFSLTPVTLASQPTNVTNGLATGLRGLIASAAADGSSFSVAEDFVAGTSAPAWQVSSNASTVFQGITGALQLAAGLPVDMDVAIQPDGTLVATRIAVYDTYPANLSLSVGPLIYFVPSGLAPEGQLPVEGQGPDQTTGTWPDNFGNAVFQISGQLANVSTLPFTADFNASSMVPGQNILVTAHSMFEGVDFLASTVTLIPQTIDGTVGAIASSGNFTSYTVSLAPYNLFPTLAQLPGQVNLLTDPGSVVVYVDSGTQMLNSDPLGVGGVFRFYGLVFDDNGTLRMDCAQIDDGVAE